MGRFVVVAVCLLGCDQPSTSVTDGGRDAPEADVAATQKRVFVSSALYTGNLGGLAGGDAACQQLATAVALTGTFKAWLSDSTTPARDRMTQWSLPYVLVDGTLVADGWNGLTSGTLMHAINRNEVGALPPTGSISCAPYVWTSTWEDGRHVLNDCNGWTTSLANVGGDGGSWTATTAAWSYNACGDTLRGCSGTAALYCIEQ